MRMGSESKLIKASSTSLAHVRASQACSFQRTELWIEHVRFLCWCRWALRLVHAEIQCRKSEAGLATVSQPVTESPPSKAKIISP